MPYMTWRNFASGIIPDVLLPTHLILREMFSASYNPYWDYFCFAVIILFSVGVVILTLNVFPSLVQKAIVTPKQVSKSADKAAAKKREQENAKAILDASKDIQQFRALIREQQEGRRSST